MMKIIKNNKAVLRFLGLFALSYIVLTAIYTWYLRTANPLDSFTQLVSNHTVAILQFLGFPITEVVNTNTTSLFFNDYIIAYIAEGCNAISVMILFVAFIIAFAQKWKFTLLYILLGLLFIYVINSIRIVMFIILLEKHPEYSSFLHDLFFPAIIYGSVFLLWMNWIRLLKKNKKNV